MFEFATFFTLGGLTLLDLFNNCVDTFRYVQFGRHFKDDFGERLVLFDLLKLRFLRWGNAVLNSDPYLDIHMLPQITILCMTMYMQDTIWFSQKYQPDGRRAIGNPVLPPSYERMRLELEDIALDRTWHDGPLLRKRSFIIDTPELFDAVLKALMFSVEHLERLFRMEDVIYRCMADSEVAEMEPDLMSLGSLRNLAQHVDRFLFDSLTAKINEIESKMPGDFKIYANTKLVNELNLGNRQG